MKTLITPSEVLLLAFGTTHTLPEGAVPSYAIISAQESFLLPTLGEALCTHLAESSSEQSQTFLEEYLKPPLALYVASRLLPTLALQVGSAGVVRLSGESFEPVGEATLRTAVARLRTEADRLLARAIENLASYPELLPLHAPQTHKRRIVGGVVM